VASVAWSTAIGGWDLAELRGDRFLRWRGNRDGRLARRPRPADVQAVREV